MHGSGGTVDFGEVMARMRRLRARLSVTDSAARFRSLGVDLFPKADPATVNVALTLPGASPDELSTSVIEPMEEAISGVSGIDEIQARSSEGRGQITVRFVLEREINDAANDVRDLTARVAAKFVKELVGVMRR